MITVTLEPLRRDMERAVLRGLESLVFPTAGEPPPRENLHPDPPEEECNHGESAVGAKVTGSRSMVRMHHPRTHEKRYEDADRFVFKETRGSADGL